MSDYKNQLRRIAEAILADLEEEQSVDQHERCSRCGHKQKWSWYIPEEWWNVIHGEYNILCLECADDLAVIYGLNIFSFIDHLTFVGNVDYTGVKI